MAKWAVEEADRRRMNQKRRRLSPSGGATTITPTPPDLRDVPEVFDARKKPVSIKAIQWTGENFESVQEFCGEDGFAQSIAFIDDHDTLYIRTLEGYMKANIGDIIIEGVNGENYPCKPDIFWKTYDVI